MEIAVITINTDTNGDARPTLESIENVVFNSYNDIVDTLVKENIEKENIEIVSISEFMDLYNNEELNESNTFMGYVQIKN